MTIQTHTQLLQLRKAILPLLLIIAQSSAFVFELPPLSSTISTSTRTSISFTSLHLFESFLEEENDKLFAKFDADGSGSIDKDEFKNVVRKMKADSSRREVISVATATFGGLWVAYASNTFQFGQKKLRKKYLEPLAEDAMFQNFPTALLSGDCDKAIWKTLSARGFTPANTLFGHSICSDEVNNRKEQLIPLMVDRWQEGFALGGLGGIPFAGKSGFGAYLHHVPDSGKLLVFFAPHVGIDNEGRVGSLQRDGQASVSSACGAAIGAYKALQNKNAIPEDPLVTFQNLKKEDVDTKFDPQLEQIINMLAPRLKGIEESSDSVSFVTYQMYGIIRELITACITQTPDLFESATEVAVVGGVMINRRKGGDFFQPLSFETRKQCGSSETPDAPIDLFEDTFGERPDLLGVMGSEAALERASITSELYVPLE